MFSELRGMVDRMMRTIAFTLALMLSAARAAFAADYIVDTVHSQAQFTVTHLALSKVRGVVPMSASTISIAPNGMPAAAEASFDLRKVESHDENRDRSIRNDIFETDKFPNMTFSATKFDGTPQAFKMTGNLTIHGVTKPVVLDVKTEGSATLRGKKHYAFAATTTIDRREWGMHFARAVDGALFAGNEVLITLEIDALEK
jgi:polyisoprenoid-binding protein YceI